MGVTRKEFGGRIEYVGDTGDNGVEWDLMKSRDNLLPGGLCGGEASKHRLGASIN